MLLLQPASQASEKTTEGSQLFPKALEHTECLSAFSRDKLRVIRTRTGILLAQTKFDFDEKCHAVLSLASSADAVKREELRGQLIDIKDKIMALIRDCYDAAKHHDTRSLISEYEQHITDWFQYCKNQLGVQEEDEKSSAVVAADLSSLLMSPESSVTADGVEVQSIGPQASAASLTARERSSTVSSTHSCGSNDTNPGCVTVTEKKSTESQPAQPQVDIHQAKLLTTAAILEQSQRPFETYRELRASNTSDYHILKTAAGFSRGQKLEAVDKLIKCLQNGFYGHSTELDETLKDVVSESPIESVYVHDETFQETGNMTAAVGNNKSVVFTKTDIEALHQGRLGKLVAKLEERGGFANLFTERMRLDWYIISKQKELESLKSRKDSMASWGCFGLFGITKMMQDRYEMLSVSIRYAAWMRDVIKGYSDCRVDEGILLPNAIAKIDEHAARQALLDPELRAVTDKIKAQINTRFQSSAMHAPGVR